MTHSTIIELILIESFALDKEYLVVISQRWNEVAKYSNTVMTFHGKLLHE